MAFMFYFNPLPNNNSLDQSNLRAFADNIFNAIQMVIYVLDSKENILGSGENAGHQHFLLFPQCFSKASYTGSLKVGTVW